MLLMPNRMMAILLLFVVFGSGCRGTEKKEEPSQIPPEESVEEPIVPELVIPEPTPIVEEPAANPEATPPEVVVEPAPSAEPDDPETSAIRTRIAELRERRDILRKRKEEVFTRIPEKNNRRLARMRREFAEAFDALQDVSIAKEEDR